MPALASGTYLPLNLGNSWEYRTESGDGEVKTVIGTQLVFDSETSAIEYSNSTNNNGLTNFWTSDTDGSVQLWGFFREGEFGYAYDPPITMVDAPLFLGKTWQQTVDFYSFPDLQYLFPVDFQFEVVESENLTVPAGTYFAHGIELRVLRPGLEGINPMGTILVNRGTDVLDKDWWALDVGQVQYGLLEAHQYQLVSFNGPTPTLHISWGNVKSRFR